MLLKTIHASLILFLLGILATANEFDTYGAVITGLNNVLLDLDLAVLGLTMPPGFDGAALDKTFQAVLDTVKNGTETLTAMQVVGDEDATNTVITASTFPQMVTTLLGDVSKSVAAIEEKQGTGRALEFLGKFKAQSVVLVDLLVNKTPAHARDIVKDMLSLVVPSVAESIKAFEQRDDSVEVESAQSHK